MIIEVLLYKKKQKTECAARSLYLSPSLPSLGISERPEFVLVLDLARKDRRSPFSLGEAP